MKLGRRVDVCRSVARIASARQTIEETQARASTVQRKIPTIDLHLSSDRILSRSCLPGGSSSLRLQTRSQRIVRHVQQLPGILAMNRRDFLSSLAVTPLLGPGAAAAS